MGMKLISKIRNLTKLKNYGIAKTLKTQGVEVTTQGIDAYERPTARSMRLDILCGLRRLSGKSWEEFGKWLDDEFDTKTRN